ncbi:MAG TPA: hypothetical protein VNY05_09315 [Candidatus Acidoferrales bacterium]|nr:hypothetical protein [Candidatus Acidoferrales bacterium]
MAAAHALACTESEMQQAFVVPSADPLVPSIQSLLASRNQWTGPAAQLLKLLPPTALYQTPKGLSQQLRKSAQSLLAAAIELKFTRLPGGVRIIELRQIPCDASSENRPQHASPGATDSLQGTEPDDVIAA